MSDNPRLIVHTNNQRVAKLIDGQIVEKYLWANLTTLLAIYNADDSLKQRFEYATQRMPISMTIGSEKYYLHYDQVGSIRAVSDSSHTLIKEIVYDSFGNILSESNEDFKVPFGFAGGLYDADTKLTLFGYRDYDAFIGKWTGKDPMGFIDTCKKGISCGEKVKRMCPPNASMQCYIDQNLVRQNCINGYLNDIGKEIWKKYVPSIVSPNPFEINSTKIQSI